MKTTKARMGAFLVSLSLVTVAAAAGASGPVAVSPGSVGEAVLVGEACPTFSWVEVEGAGAYEIAVWRIPEEAEKSGEPEVILRETLPGGAQAWTPSLGQCLGRGEGYAWAVGAEGDEGAVAWSEPAFFEVAAGPTEAELREAVALVRQYLADEADAVDEVDATDEVETAAGDAPSPPETGDRARAAGASKHVTTLMSVDGNVDAVSFTSTETTTGALTLSGLDCTANTNGGALTADATGMVYCSDDDGGSGDDLGDHVANQNIQLNGNYLSGDGGSEGVWITDSGDVGIGTTGPGERLEVSGAVVLGDSTAAVPVAGTVRWNPTTGDFEGYEGEDWISLTGAGVNTPPAWCPDGGFIPVNDDYCIQAVEFATVTTYFAAEDVCSALDPGANRIHLCTYDEWFYACQVQDTLDPALVGMTGPWEWVDDPALAGGGATDPRRVSGASSCENTTTIPAHNSFNYRCCFDRN